MKKRILVLLVFGGIVALPWIACNKDLSNIDCGSIPATYATDVKPIITANCSTSGCHGAGSHNGDFTTYAGLKTVADNGQLDNRVNVARDMPPSSQLSLDDRKKIKCWINNGALNN